ncbi:MAG TPA: TonB-dependent receptor [Woeseiaceae bacterium]|nr:TonB-dependent receptor [Woeseiaceae bacterium]
MHSNTKTLRAIRLAFIAGAVASSLGSAPVAFGQDDEAEKLEEITVTGSRIAKRDAIAESPIFTVDKSALQSSGYVTLDQYLNTLPQITPNISSQSNNPSSGGRAFIDLRGLGANRNLVLIDGRRAMGQASGGTVVDTNTIPAALIDRVEIISGGAAATYGADAIAGVVNFIIKKDFEGVALDTQYRLTEEGDGDEITADMTFGYGFADGKGSAVFNASYFDRKAMYKGARGFSSQASSATGTFPNGSFSAGANTPSQAAVDAMFGAGVCASNGGSRGFGLNPDGSLFCTGVPGNSSLNIFGYTGPDSHVATQFAPDSFSYNFEPDNILVLPLERWNMYTHISFEQSEYFQPYVQAMFTNYNAKQELAATPVGGLSIPVTNPFIPANLATLLAARATPGANFNFNKRFSALGGRTGENTHDVWQLTAGAKGDLTETWSYDVYGNFGRSVRNEIQGGNVRLNRVADALNAADGGASLCSGGLNLFGDSAISPECQAYVSLQAKNLTVVVQSMVEAVVNGDLFEMPAGTAQAAVGASYREIDFDFLPDSGLQPGLVAGFNEQLPVSGVLNYTDLFAEFSVPILSDKPMVQNLSTTLGVRGTDNNAFGSETSWKATFDWTMVDTVRARGGFQHAIRSPNINELFAPQLNNFPNFANQDPCNFNSSYRTGPNAAQVVALCNSQATVAGGAAFSQPFGQAQAINGGNPNLTPETADSWSVGFVISPEFSSSLAQRVGFTVDYFSIELEDVVSAVGAVTIITRCYNNEGANPTYSPTNEWCSLFNRDSADGRVIDLQQFQRNQSVWEVSGIDLTTNWGMDIGPGEFDLALLASWTEKFETQTTNIDPFNDFAGTIGSTTGSATPDWRGTLQLTYGMDKLQVKTTTRYVSSMSHAALVTNPSATATGTDSVWYTDIAGRYDLSESMSFRIGINNVANQQPRLYSPNVQANTDPSTFDVLGRRYFIGFEWRM